MPFFLLLGSILCHCLCYVAAHVLLLAGLREVFKVAFKQYHTEAGSAAQPTLYFVPNSPLLDATSELTSCAEGATLSSAGSWSYTVAYVNSAAQAGSKLGNAGLIQVPQQLWADNVS